MASQIRIALAGNPNSGKSSLFNALTGAHQHVGNYPGVTVEKKEGQIFYKGREIKITDLPGAYSLTAYSLEERVARDFLIAERPDLVVAVVDAANLERNLYLVVQFLELGLPLIIALNMVDVAEARGIKIDPARLSKRLGVPVVPTVARAGKGKSELLEAILVLAEEKRVWRPLVFSYGLDIDNKIAEINDLLEAKGSDHLPYPGRWLALKVLEGDPQIREAALEQLGETGPRLIELADGLARHVAKTLDETPEGLIADYRYGFINSLSKEVVSRQTTQELTASDRIDKIVLSRLAGPLILLGVLYATYQVTFGLSQWPVGWCEAFFGWLGDLLTAILPAGLMRSLVVSGVIDGVGGVLVFVPLIAIMFMAIAILEDSGYMARIAIIMDRIMRACGLHGSSVLALIVGGGIVGGCAVPGIMASRTLRANRERLATILVVPFMNCGAKLPVYAMLIAAFFPHRRAEMLFLLTLISWGLALGAAWLLRHTVLKGEATPFLMELPPYRLPTGRGVLIHAWERTWLYLRKAGTIILAISIIMWAIMTFPGLSAKDQAAFESRRSLTGQPEVLAQIEAEEARARLEGSLAGRLGQALSRLTSPLGFDWRVNVALVGGFTAKEVVLSTLGTAFSVGQEDQDTGLAERLSQEPGFNPLVAFSLIVFIMVYAPCVASLAVIRREAGWSWAFFSLAFNTIFAYLISLAVYQTGRLLGWG